MYCKNCGRLISDNYDVCPYCNKPTRSSTVNSYSYQSNTNSTGESKTAIGVLLSLFLGLIGLIIGLLLYPTGSTERQTFLSGWIKCFVVQIIIGFILGLLFGCIFLDYIGQIA